MAWRCPSCNAQWPASKGTPDPLCLFCARASTESHPDLLEFPYDVERVLTLNVALQDVSMPAGLCDADPYGFVSQIGVISIETEVAIVATSRTYSSRLLELEKTLEPLLPIDGDMSSAPGTPAAATAAGGGDNSSTSITPSAKEDDRHPAAAKPPSALSVSVSETDDTSGFSKATADYSQSTDSKLSPQTELKNLVIAYFCLTDLATRLNLPNVLGITKHALSLYRHCSQHSNMRNRHVESLAIAALVLASRQFNSPRTIQEVAKESNVKIKEIGRYLKLLSDAHKDHPQRPRETSSLVVEYVQRFSTTLGLSQRVQEVATHIATQLITQTLTTRQNPVSISASAIYITCLLEDVKRTQSEICKTAALTEVTLRKCYREVAVHCKALLPPSYVPAVPIDRALMGIRTGPPLPSGSVTPKNSSTPGET